MYLSIMEKEKVKLNIGSGPYLLEGYINLDNGSDNYSGPEAMLKEAQEENKIIIELPCGTHSRSMGKEDTLEYLRDIGER